VNKLDDKKSVRFGTVQIGSVVRKGNSDIFLL
jgi:hypothetical protein